jgi:hypothetical protein
MAPAKVMKCQAYSDQVLSVPFPEKFTSSALTLALAVLVRYLFCLFTSTCE